MSIMRARRTLDVSEAAADRIATEVEAKPSRGPSLPTLLSVAAVGLSCASFYVSALQQAQLEVFVPPVLQYGRDGGGDVDVLAIPITIANGGASTGTVLAMELKVEALGEPEASREGARTKTFYSAFVGEHPRSSETPNKTFAPISVPGRATYSETIRFYPQGSALPKVVTDKGEYRFTLSLTLAGAAEPGLLDRLIPTRTPPPLVFTRRLPYLSDQHVGYRRATISMHAADWKPTSSAAK